MCDIGAPKAHARVCVNRMAFSRFDKGVFSIDARPSKTHAGSRASGGLQRITGSEDAAAGSVLWMWRLAFGLPWFRGDAVFGVHSGFSAESLDQGIAGLPVDPYLRGRDGISTRTACLSTPFLVEA